MYISPPYLDVATGPHQDAHSVFIVQTHGAKRWCVHAPLAPLTLKPLQRGKNGDVIDPLDQSVMGPPLLNVTLRPGRVLYIPRGFFHHTATDAASLAAEDVVDGSLLFKDYIPTSGVTFDISTPAPSLAGVLGVKNHAGAADLAADADAGQPSMALTLSILSEDVWATWMSLLGEALQELPSLAEAESIVAALRRVAAQARRVEGDAGARLREALPRAIMAECARSEAPFFTVPKEASWRRYAVDLLESAIIEDGRMRPPEWLQHTAPEDALFVALDAVIVRKRIPCYLKRTQIEAMQAAVAGRTPLTGEPQSSIDVDTIFLIEKQDKSYLPRDRTWFQPQLWK